MYKLDYQQYVEYYHQHNTLPGKRTTYKNTLNDAQLRHNYNNYLKSFTKQEAAQSRYIEKEVEKAEQIRKGEVFRKGTFSDPEWMEVRAQVFERDDGDCQLIITLSKDERDELEANASGFLNTIDPAHVLPKSAYPAYYYTPMNIVCLNRYSHSMLDIYHHPLNGRTLTKDQHQEWWERIVGKSYYKALIDEYSRKMT